MMCAVMCKTCK